MFAPLAPFPGELESLRPLDDPWAGYDPAVQAPPSQVPAAGPDVGLEVLKRPAAGSALCGGRRGRRLSPDVRSRLIEDVIEASSPSSCRLETHPAQTILTPGRACSIWGRASHAADSFAPFFASKPMNFDGELSQMVHRIGVVSHRGQKADSPNQDDFFIISRPESLLFGVLDGHGQDGHHVAHFAQEWLPKLLVERLKLGQAWADAVRGSFEDANARLAKELPNSEFSGSTVSLAMIESSAARSLRLRLAFVGDSAIVHAKRQPGASWDWTRLMNIHRPDRKDESARIKAAGGSVAPAMGSSSSRLETPEWSLGMSRSFGDCHALPFGLSHEPEVPEELQLQDKEEHFLLACSDGIWDMVSPAQAVAFVGKFAPNEAQLAAERLVSKAQLRWQQSGHLVDDITAVVVWLQFAAEIPPKELLFEG